MRFPTLGLGLAALGRPGYINLGHAEDLGGKYEIATMEAHAHDVLDAAWDAGIRYFDVARSYGRAEQFLATWLDRRQINPADVVVGSKWGYTYTADWQVQALEHEVKEHSLAVLNRHFGESTAILGPYLDLYQIHSATLDSGVLDNTAVLDRLARLKGSGLRIGLSLSGPGQPKTLAIALTIRRDGQRLFDAVQATWNLLERSAGPALADAQAAGLVVIVKEALANGRLTPRNDDPRLAPLHAAAAEQGATVDALALAAVLAQPWAGIVLSGAATVEHVASNFRGRLVMWSDDLDERLHDLREEPDAYWETRARLPWN